MGCDAHFVSPDAWRSFTRKMIQNAGLNRMGLDKASIIAGSAFPVTAAV
jgi:hypothetical protein